MILVRDAEQDAATGVEIVTTPEGLAAIRRPDRAAVIWRRQPTARFQTWIDGLEPARLPKARMIVSPSDVREAARQIGETAGTPDGAERAQLIDDVAALANIFATLTRAPYLRLRVDVVTTNACRKFHVDAVTARLICTYRGTGTQYGISINGAEPKQIFTVPSGAPIVLRGTLWPGRPRSGLLHRSPPIAGTGETRFVLVFDPVMDPENDT